MCLCDLLRDGLDGLNGVRDKLDFEEIDVVENVAHLHHQSNLELGTKGWGGVGRVRLDWVQLGSADGCVR